MAFTKYGLTVKNHAWDRNLGGRDFDEVLFNHFADEFKAKKKLDIRTNPKASFKLRTAVERVCAYTYSIICAHCVQSLSYTSHECCIGLPIACCHNTGLNQCCCYCCFAAAAVSYAASPCLLQYNAVRTSHCTQPASVHNR